MPLLDHVLGHAMPPALLVVGLLLALVGEASPLGAHPWGRLGARRGSQGPGRALLLEALTSVALAWALLVPLSVPMIDAMEPLVGPLGYDPWSPGPWMAWAVVMAGLACTWPLGDGTARRDLLRGRTEPPPRADFLREPPPG